MNKHNLLIKKVKKQILSINDSIESSFNKLKYFKNNFKKTKLSKNNKVFLASAIAVILTLSYFLIPTLYNKDLMQTQIKNHIIKKYDTNYEFIKAYFKDQNKGKGDSQKIAKKFTKNNKKIIKNSRIGRNRRNPVNRTPARFPEQQYLSTLVWATLGYSKLL